MLAAIDWTYVLVALIGGLPAIISAAAAVSVRRQIKTPSGTNIGKQVEDSHHTALANHYLLRASASEIGVATPPSARREAGLVDDLAPEGDD